MSSDASNTSETPDVDPLETLQQRIDYRFKDANLLQSALTHASGAEHRLGAI
jgi:dsRNA-specific ribonuclease